MKIKHARRAAALTIGMAALAMGLPVYAQVNRNQPNRPNQLNRRPAAKNYSAELKALAESLSKKYEAKIVVDPAIFVRTKPTAPGETASITEALASITGQIKNTAWRRIYLKQSQANTVATPDKLAASIRALERVEQMGLVLENPTSKAATSYLKNYEVTQTFGQDLKDMQFDAGGVYVIYSTSPWADLGGAKSTEDRFFDLQREQMEMMMQMDPDQLGQAMARGMDLWSNMDPALRGQFMGQMMRAGMQMWNNMPAEQRQTMMQEMMQNAQQFFGGFGGNPPPGGGRP